MQRIAAARRHVLTTCSLSGKSVLPAGRLSSASSASFALRQTRLRSTSAATSGSSQQTIEIPKKADDDFIILRHKDMSGTTGRENFSSKVRERNEAFSIYYACLATGNVERARSLLSRLHNVPPATAIKLHNQYLFTLVGECAKAQDLSPMTQWLDKMQKEFDIVPNETTYAILCKGALGLTDKDMKEMMLKTFAEMFLKKKKGVLGDMIGQAGVYSVDEIRALIDMFGLSVANIKQGSRQVIADALAAAERQVPEDDVQNIAEVAPTKVSGPGMHLLKQSLAALIDPNYSASDNEARIPFSMLESYERQKILEESALDAAVARWKHDHEETANRGKLNPLQKSLNALLWEWHQALVPLIKDEVRRCKEAQEGTKQAKGADLDRLAYGPCLLLLSPEQLSTITILELLRLQGTGGVAEGMRVARAVLSLGKQVESEAQADMLKQQADSGILVGDMKTIFSNEKAFALAKAKAKSRAKGDMATPDTEWRPDWPHTLRARVGSVLISLLMHVAKVPNEAENSVTGEKLVEVTPAFFHAYQYSNGKKLGVIKMHPALMRHLGTDPMRGNVHPRLLPMVVPPRPWLSWNNGGYLRAKTRVMRSRDAPEQLLYLKKASDRGDLDLVFAGLDVLGRTAWAINRRVLDVAVTVWNAGEAIASIPATDTNFEYPPEPPADCDPAIRALYVRKCKEVAHANQNKHSLRCDVNYKLEIARAFVNEKMYFPHNIDFRGRAYPIPPHFNHLGNDLCRGLLVFHEAKELGAAGLRWLKIHMANVRGFDKANFSERAAYTMENLENIFDSADNPLGGKRWWLEAEDPWQCLATCFELADALRSPNPEKYMSRMPVHQDGTCNGLQHYAALGGDIVGAKQVNLEPSDSPQDVYTGVANLVAAEVERDAAAGNVNAQELVGKITRKVVKQTVMTNVYGVTWIGARDQIEGQLKDVGIPDDRAFALAAYVTKIVFSAMKSMFSGAHMIQDWLSDAAKVIAKAHPIDADDDTAMTAVIWTTPLNLPVVQPYRKISRKQIMTNLQTVFISNPDAMNEVDVRKQRTAFPPNFIHSLDATHMLMSALATSEAGITFAAVHDSYWTHASDVDKMNVMLRDAFVRLHQDDIMGNLKREFEERYKGYKTQMSALAESAEGKAILAQRASKSRAKSKEADVADVADAVDAADAASSTSAVAAMFSEEVVPKQKRTVKWWGDLVFRPLPAKGEWDVQNLKQSQYFFS
ncbi:DNA-directed RNA polymerase [Saitoella coloradoensis]